MTLRPKQGLRSRGGHRARSLTAPSPLARPRPSRHLRIHARPDFRADLPALHLRRGPGLSPLRREGADAGARVPRGLGGGGPQHRLAERQGPVLRPAAGGTAGDSRPDGLAEHERPSAPGAATRPSRLRHSPRNPVAPASPAPSALPRASAPPPPLPTGSPKPRPRTPAQPPTARTPSQDPPAHPRPRGTPPPPRPPPTAHPPPRNLRPPP